VGEFVPYQKKMWTEVLVVFGVAHPYHVWQRLKMYQQVRAVRSREMPKVIHDLGAQSVTLMLRGDEDQLRVRREPTRQTLERRHEWLEVAAVYLRPYGETYPGVMLKVRDELYQRVARAIPQFLVCPAEESDLIS
jgi:hypothetical protein